MHFVKDKRFIMVACASVFLLVVFFSKTGFGIGGGEKNRGLSAGNEYLDLDATVEDLVNNDADGDGVFDWEEALWGTDPNKKDSDDNGVSDETEIAKMKSESGVTSGGELSGTDEENLTETDKFSREFFSTVAALNQNGVMDEVTVEQLSNSLAERIQNSSPRKVFLLSDVVITKDNSVQDIKDYENALEDIRKKYPVKGNISNILEKFIIDENTVDVGVLGEIDPIIKQTNYIITALTKTPVPQSISSLHLNMINAMERLVENISDIKLYEDDVIVSLSAISQYDQNTTALAEAINNLASAVSKSLSN